jgi:hypothetical protein
LSFPFDARRGLVIVQSELFGPSGSIVLRLALDTGATGTRVNIGPLAIVGYDPSLAPERVQVTTGSGVEFVPLIAISELKAWDIRAPVFLSWVTPCPRARASMVFWGWTFSGGKS